MVDTNVVLSALISDSTTREVIKNLDHDIFSPVYLQKEIKKHRELVQEKSGISEKETKILIEKIFRYINFIPESEVKEYREPAKEAIEDTDPDDVLFVATALAVDGAVWSDDTDFLRQDRVEVLTTEDIVHEF
ncbi:MAG: PIN domain-containing protein [Halobacteria archaeon]